MSSKIIINEPLENRYDQDTNKYEIFDENQLKQFFSNKNIKPKIVLVLDSNGGITPIKLSGYNVTKFSDITQLNRKIKAKIPKLGANKSVRNAEDFPAMFPVRYSDGISILGVGNNSCEYICCNGDIIEVCD